MTPSPFWPAAITRPARPIPTKIREAQSRYQKKNMPARKASIFRPERRRLHGYNIVKNEKGTIVYDKHIDFND